MPTRVLRAPDEVAWVETAGRHFVRLAIDAIEKRNAFHVVVPGGSTPRRVFEWLTADPPGDAGSVPATRERRDCGFDWARVHIYFGDERCVPPTDASSNYRMIRESLLDHVPIPDVQVHRVAGELEAREAATRYNEQLMSLLGSTTPPSGAFDAVLLGLGPDGHTASLIPGVPLDYLAPPWVGVGPAPLSPAKVPRITLTADALRATRETVFWVRGSDKAAVVRAALQGEGPPTMVPEVTAGTATVTWVLDDAAASLLGPGAAGGLDPSVEVR